MKKIILFFICLLILQSSCNKGEVKDFEDNCYSNTNAQVITHDSVDREYILYVPNSYDGITAVPLMINFHGYNGSASEYMAWADMRPEADSENFILVYPQGSCLEGSSHWNPCPSGGDNKSSIDDFGFVEAMINEIANQYNIDMERIYVAGYSNGGMMSYGLAHFRSDLISAVASVSGAMLDCEGPSNHPIPVLHLHGTSDDVISYDGSSDYNSAQDVLDYWVNFNNTTSIPTINSDNDIEHQVYDQGDNGVSVEHYKYIGGEHVWFSKTYQGQTTSQLIWNFVSRFDINGLR
jgi:polyhydroxybutyrate depolymerase